MQSLQRSSLSFIAVMTLICVNVIHLVGGAVLKCCSNDNILMENITSEKRFQYSCVPRSNDLVNTIGYNMITNSATNNIPDCDRVELIKINSDESANLPVKSCVDFLNNDLYALNCAKDDEYFDVQIVKYQKCCPHGQTFHLKTRVCVEFQESTVIFSAVINRVPAIVQSELPQCKPGEVTVEYNSHSHKLDLINGHLKVNSQSTGTHYYNKWESFCIDGVIDGIQNIPSGWMARVCQKQSVCESIPCIRKCCKDAEKYVKVNGTSKCLPHSVHYKPKFHDVDLPFNETTIIQSRQPLEFGILPELTCKKYVLYPDEPDDLHYLHYKTGLLYIASLAYPLNDQEYCKEFVQRGAEAMEMAFVCFDQSPKITKFKFYPYGLSVSVFFLAITLLVYAFLPKLCNLHGKTLVCHVVSMLSAFIVLAIIQFNDEEKMTMCKELAFITYFSFLSAFSWLNIMCFDIWWTLGSVRQSRGMRKSRETRRFLCYSAYAWGVPLFLTATTYVFNDFDIIPLQYRPNFGVVSCWFSDNNTPGHLIFFIAPIGIQIFSNMVLFTLTSLHCNKVKGEIHKMQDQPDEQKQTRRRFIAHKAKFTMTIKLFVVMGVSWMLEILCTVWDGANFWYIPDAFNILQGIPIFLIFVFKPKVLLEFKKRFGLVPQSTQMTYGTSTTMRTGSNTINDPYSCRYGPIKKMGSATTMSSSLNNSQKNLPLNKLH